MHLCDIDMHAVGLELSRECRRDGDGNYVEQRFAQEIPACLNLRFKFQSVMLLRLLFVVSTPPDSMSQKKNQRRHRR